MVKVKGASKAGTGATLNACPGWRWASSISATTTSAAALALVHRTIVGPSWHGTRDCAASYMAQPPYWVVSKIREDTDETSERDTPLSVNDDKRETPPAEAWGAPSCTCSFGGLFGMCRIAKIPPAAEPVGRGGLPHAFGYRLGRCCD